MRLNNSCKDYAEITKFTTTERRIHPKGELKKEIKEKRKKKILRKSKDPKNSVCALHISKVMSYLPILVGNTKQLAKKLHL